MLSSINFDNLNLISIAKYIYTNKGSQLTRSQQLALGYYLLLQLSSLKISLINLLYKEIQCIWSCFTSVCGKMDWINMGLFGFLLKSKLDYYILSRKWVTLSAFVHLLFYYNPHFVQIKQKNIIKVILSAMKILVLQKLLI